MHAQPPPLNTQATYSGQQQQQPASVYIKNLPPEADKLYLYEHFARHGAVLSVKVRHLFGFASYAHRVVVVRPGGQRDCAWASVRYKRIRNAAEYGIYGWLPMAPLCWQSQRLKLASTAQVMTDEATGKCRGVGFVNYGSFAGASAAIAAMHGTIVGDKVLHVSLQQQRAEQRTPRRP
jgi:RNA recognition motif-containing protein